MNFMYRIFCESVKNFFAINKEGEQKNEYRLKIAQPIKALADKSLYFHWKKNEPLKYDEVNNLVYEIDKNKDRLHSFKTFSWDLWGHGYESMPSEEFDEETVREQLKLINLLLSRQYWL